MYRIGVLRTAPDASTDVLARQPLGRQIADRLRREILFGVIGPDDHLTQDSICVRFGTSRIPVRDAIMTLLREGLLQKTRFGIIVAELTDRDLGDIFRIEGVLHGLATRMATQRATDSQLEELDDTNRSIEAALASGKSEVASHLNADFHHRINLLTDSGRMISALRATSAKIDGEYLQRFPEHGQAALLQHRRIVEAMLARDADTASVAMHEHVYVQC